MSTLVESPIEADFLDAVRLVRPSVVVLEKVGPKYLRYVALHDETDRSVFIAPQVKIGRYRADFIMARYWSGIYPKMLCVECDGHLFHSGAANIYRDAKRDSWFRSQLVDVMRFSGRQIKRDPYKCARIALSRLTSTPHPTPVELYSDETGEDDDAIE